MVLAILVSAVCCLLPVGYLLLATLGSTDALSAVMLDARQRRLLMTTAVLGAGTALLATAIGAPLGVWLARLALPHKALLRVALAAPLVLPPYIVGLAWTYLGGRLLSDWTYSLPAAVLILSLVFYPLSMLATEVAMRRIDGRLEEAALTVAAPARVVRRITLPLAAPAVSSAGLMIFVLAVSEFGVPALLRVRVYTTEIFTAFASLYDFGRALLLAVPLLILCLLVASVAAVLLGDRVVSTRRGSGTRPPLFDGWHAVAITSVATVLMVAVVLPVGMLLREALGARSLMAAVAGSGAAMTNSLLLAAVGATGTVSVAVCLGYGRARAKRSIGRIVDVLCIVVFAVPSTIVGVGLIGFWNRPGPAGMMYGTDVMFLLGYLARFLPVATLALAASVRSVPASHEEAAAVSGAPWLRTMWRIVLPQIRPGLAAAWVIAFVLAFGELGVSILVAPPGEATLPIRVYTLIANTPSANVAALALLQAGVVVAPLAALGIALARRETA